MKQRVKPFTLFLCISILIFIIFGPVVIYRGLRRPNPLELIKSNKPKWTGMIKIWHVGDYTICGRGNVETWLKDAITAIEGRYPEVFFEVRSMTPDRLNMYFQEDLDRDVLPDIVSLNTYDSIVSPHMLEDLNKYFSKEELKLLIQPAKDMSTRDNKLIGLPYMIGWYTFIINTELVDEEQWEYADIDLGEDMGWDVLHQLISKVACDEEDKNTTEHFGFVSYESPYSRPIECVVDSYIDRWIVEGMAPANMGEMTYDEGWRIFALERRAGIFLGPTKAIYTIRGSEEKGEIPPGRVLPIPKGTYIKVDQLGSYGLLKQDDEYKRMICIDFLRELLGEDMQISLDGLGMFSVRRDITHIYDADEDMGRLEEQLNGLYKYEK